MTSLSATRSAALNRYPCPCCGYLTLNERPAGDAECPVCCLPVTSSRDMDTVRSGRSMDQAWRSFQRYGTYAPGSQTKDVHRPLKSAHVRQGLVVEPRPGDEVKCNQWTC
jgi:hypothetical protein